MSNDWQVFVEYRPGMMSTFIYVSRRVTPGRVEFLIKGGDEARTIEQEDALKDEVYFARFEDEFIGRLIVEALDKRGIKAPAQSYTEGKLQATQEHLQDLRKLIPKLNQPPNPKLIGEDNE